MKVAVLTGGVGGAKFLLGLQGCGRAEQLTAIVNTGDDFRHLGLHIAPDIDTMLYTLSGQANKIQGWGRENESWDFMAASQSLGGPGWFRLGDGDLALHVLRTHRLAEREALSSIVADFARHWGIQAAILPMSDDPVSTWLDTDDGALAFQNYFVERQCRPIVRAIRFEGAEFSRPAPGVMEALEKADIVFIAPSNPWLSIDPILAVPDIAAALRRRADAIAISPLIGGRAVKGPTGKIMAELGAAPTNDAIAEHYAGILGGLVHDVSDPPPAALPSCAVPTLMIALEEKIRVAEAALDFAAELSG